MPETPEAETPEAETAEAETPEAEPEAETPAPEPEAETPAPETPALDEPGSPRRKRPRPRREPAPTIPHLDAGFWHQLVLESRATREAARRERYANLFRFQ